MKDTDLKHLTLKTAFLLIIKKMCADVASGKTVCPCVQMRRVVKKFKRYRESVSMYTPYGCDLRFELALIFEQWPNFAACYCKEDRPYIL